MSMKSSDKKFKIIKVALAHITKKYKKKLKNMFNTSNKQHYMGKDGGINF